MVRSFYRDRKIHESIVDTFPKMPKEKKKMVKNKGITYFQAKSLNFFGGLFLGLLFPTLPLMVGSLGFICIVLLC